MPPKIDGRLDDGCWQIAARITSFTQHQPKNGGPPTGSVTAYLAYDQHNLYVAARVQERGSDIRSYITKRDDVMASDVFMIALDPTGTHEQLYMFWVTPAGIQADSTFTPQGNMDFSWDTIWYADGRRTEDGYTVEMAIPFRSLRYRGTGTQRWDFLFARLMPKNNELDISPPVSETDFQSNMFAFLGHMRLNVASLPREMAVIPYGTGHFLAQNGAPDHYGGRGGADFIYAPTAKLTLNGTVIPDFSEVEADQPQVDINLNQPLFFPEKRPFFTTGANVFQTAGNGFFGNGNAGLFYSRKIVNPRAGLKATGEVARWQIGALVAQDHALPGLSGSEDAEDAAFRLKRPIRVSSFIGMFSTLKSSPEARNQILGIDSDIHFAHVWDWQTGIFSSHTAGQNETAQAVSNIGPDSVHPNTTRSSGYSGTTTVGLNTDNDNLGVQLSAVSPNFDPQLGFQQQTDLKNAGMFAGHSWRINKHGLQMVRVFTSHNRTYSYDFGLAQQADSFGGFVQLTGQTFINYSFNHNYNQWNHSFYDLNTQSFGGGTNILSWFKVNTFYNWGPAINYSGSYLGYSRSTNFDIGSDVKRFHTDLNGQDYRFSQSAAGPRVLSSLVWFWRTEYYLDKRTYLRNILLGSSSDKTLQHSLLLRRIVRPGTEFYFGFGSAYLRSFENGSLTQNPALLTPAQRHFLFQQRTVFFKFSRRFDFLD